MKMFRLLLVIAVAAISNLFAADVSGKWTGTMETGGDSIGIFLTLNRYGPDLSGTMATLDEPRPVPIEKGEVHEDRLTFEVREVRDNAGRIFNFRLAFTDGRISGEASVGDQVSKVTLSQAPIAYYPIAGGLGPQRPVLLSKVEPEYTEEARVAKLQGTVVLKVEIDPNGTPTDITVQRSLGMGLDEKAIQAVKQWKFKPASDKGRPVAATTTIFVNFRL
jgi:TonB family protein